MTTNSSVNGTIDVEREALLTFLAQQREFLLTTLQGLDEERATRCTTDSSLHLAGIVKHLNEVERSWIAFIQDGPVEVDYEDPETFEKHENGFRLLEGETLEGILADYAETARATEEYVRSLPDLEVSHPLPEAPWFEKGVSWTARDVLLHMLREISQHCGHADIVRESLDGQKTMG